MNLLENHEVKFVHSFRQLRTRTFCIFILFKKNEFIRIADNCLVK